MGSESDQFLAVGTFVGYAIIVPSVLVTYLLGANLTILVRIDCNFLRESTSIYQCPRKLPQELFINLVGAILFIASGVLCLSYHNNRTNDTLGMVLGILAISTGVVFLIDFLLAIKNTRVTIIQTRTI